MAEEFVIYPERNLLKFISRKTVHYHPASRYRYNPPANRPMYLSYQNTKDYIVMHYLFSLSGRYNSEGCRFSLDTNLNIELFTFMLSGNQDISLVVDIALVWSVIL